MITPLRDLHLAASAGKLPGRVAARDGRLIDRGVLPAADRGHRHAHHSPNPHPVCGADRGFVVAASACPAVGAALSGLVLSLAAPFGRCRLVAGLCHDPGPHDRDGLGGLGARCLGIFGLGPGGRAWAISSFGSADLLDSKSGPGKENGEPPLGRLPVN